MGRCRPRRSTSCTGARDLLGLYQRERVARRKVRAEPEIGRRVASGRSEAVRADRAPDAREVERKLHRAVAAHGETADRARERALERAVAASMAGTTSFAV